LYRRTFALKWNLESRPEFVWWSAIVALLLLVWLAPTFPTQDGPSHLYNLVLFKGLWQGDPHFTTHHLLDQHSTTNLGFLILSWPLSLVMPIWAVERAIVTIHLLLISYFALSWLRVTSRPTFPTAWMAFAFAFPWPLFMGFYGFQLACDLAMLGVCAAWRLRTRPLLQAAPALWLLGLAIVPFHPGGAGLFALFVALIDLTRPGAPFLRGITRGLCLSMPVVVALALTLTHQPALQPDMVPPLGWQSVGYNLMLLVTFASVTFAGQGLVFLLVASSFVYLCLRPNQAPHVAPDHAIRFCLAGSASLLLIHLILPDTGFGGGFMTGRFVGWVPLLLLPLLNTAKSSATLGGRLPSLLAPAVGIASIASHAIALAPLSKDLGEIRDAGRSNTSDGIVAGVFFDRRGSTTAMIEPLLHIDSYFAIPRGILATNYEAKAAFFPIRRSEEGARDFAQIDRAALRDIEWRSLLVDLLVTIDATPADRENISEGYLPVWRGGRERVEAWRRRP
jgi:hypothetical protein